MNNLKSIFGQKNVEVLNTIQISKIKGGDPGGNGNGNQGQGNNGNGNGNNGCPPPWIV